MADDPNEGALRVPERLLPIPGHLSPQAKAFMSRPAIERGTYPALDDKEGWRQHIAGGDRMILEGFLAHVPGCFVFVGNGAQSKPLHNPWYDFNDEGLLCGTRLHAAIVRRRLPTGPASRPGAA